LIPNERWCFYSAKRLTDRGGGPDGRGAALAATTRRRFDRGQRSPHGRVIAGDGVHFLLRAGEVAQGPLTGFAEGMTMLSFGADLDEEHVLDAEGAAECRYLVLVEFF